MRQLQYHKLSDLFPLMPEHELVELTDSIKRNGQQVPIVLYQGKILDGRNRYLACRRLKREPRSINFANGRDALAYVWATNFERRHLNESQRAIAAAKLATMGAGRPSKNESTDTITATDAARMSGTSRPSIVRAKKVLERGTKKQIEAVTKGEKSVSAAASEITEKEKRREEALDDMGYAVPDGNARKYWDRREEAAGILSAIRAAKLRVKGILTGDALYAEVNLNGVLSDLGNAINRFAAAIPAYVCPYCQGRNTEKCTTCKGRGVVSKFMWSIVPEEIRKMREKQVRNGK